MSAQVASLVEIMVALAEQIEDAFSTDLPGLQVAGSLLFNPTPPAIDVYPADPFQEQTAMSPRSQEATFVVRARVSTADHEGGQELLLDLMDPRRSPSVVEAITSDRTLGGTVDDSAVIGVSGFIVYQDASGPAAGSLLGCEWRVRAEL